MSRRHTKRQKRHRKHRKTLRGGAFSQQQIQQLQNNGFNEFQIEELEHSNISFDDIMNHVDAIMNQGDTGFNGNSDAMAEQVMNELLHPPNIDSQLNQSFDSQGTMDVNELNTSGYTTDSDTSTISLGPMNVDELNTSNMSGYTTEADESFGGKRRRRRPRKRTYRRHVLKGRISRHRRSGKNRHMKGGACFGNGVGSNHYDPNYSIYNTRMLSLFPYNK